VRDWVAWKTPDSGRSGATLGPAIAALENNDAAARAYVKAAADQAAYHLANYSVLPAWAGKPVGGDAREGAYKLMTVVAAYVLGLQDRSVADGMVNIIDAAQDKVGGACNGWNLPGCWKDDYGQNNFMAGLMLEALAMYDRALPGNPKAINAMKLAASFLWNTQWHPDGAGAGSFNYCTYNWPDGSCYADASGNTPLLNGLFLAGWGHLYQATGDPAYKTQGEAMANGLVTTLGFLLPDPSVYGYKISAEGYRASSLFRGYTD
jgi:hypothetical protein